MADIVKVACMSPIGISLEAVAGRVPSSDLEDVERYIHPDRRLRSLSCRYLLRRLVPDRFDQPIESEIYGKPRFSAGPEFSLSSTPNMAVAAISSVGPIGVDVENIERGIDLGLSHEDLIQWVEREAVGKALGQGVGAFESLHLVEPSTYRVQGSSDKWRVYEVAVGPLGYCRVAVRFPRNPILEVIQVGPEGLT